MTEDISTYNVPISGGYDKSYTYDAFEEKILGIKLKKGTETYGESKYSYDGKRLNGIKPFGDSYQYNIAYNDYGDVSCISLDNKKIIEKGLDRQNNTVSETRYYNDNTKAIVSTKLNNYGKTERITDSENNKTTVFDYKNAGQSPPSSSE